MKKDSPQKSQKPSDAGKDIGKSKARPGDKSIEKQSMLPYFIVIGGIIAISAAIIVLMFLNKPCTSADCFVNRANSCGTASFQKPFAGSTVEYRVKDCVLEKEFVQFGNDEPPEIVDAFKGKVLSCPYTKGKFNESFIADLTTGYASCTGDLKQLIVEIEQVVNSDSTIE
jgi:hypothetical protein